MNARPVRAAVTSTASSGCEPAAPLLEEAQQDQRRELGARGDHERSADRRHRAELEVEPPRDERRRAHGDEHRHQRQQRADDAAQPDRRGTGTTKAIAR